MKLLADENFPPALIAVLQRKRHNIRRIQRTARSISDITVIERARKENRIIITFDRDFLEVSIDEGRVNVMLFTFPYVTVQEILPHLDGAIEAMKKLKRKKKPFTPIYSEKGLEVIEPKRAREAFTQRAYIIPPLPRNSKEKVNNV